MQPQPLTTRLLVLAGSLALIFAVFFGLVRPWYLAWGTDATDRTRRLAGDGIVPNAAVQETRAITIDAPVDRVWPWVAQLGQDRGGFYSFDLLENLVGCEMPTDDRLRPDKQAWTAGDRLWMYPRNKAGGIGFATLRDYVPGRALGFGTYFAGTTPSGPEDGSWSFVLDPVNDSTTRLLVRGRGAQGRSLLGVAFDRSIFEPVHFVMERRMMIGIKDLAEGRDRDRLGNHTQIVLWTLVFVAFLASAGMMLAGIRWQMAVAGLFVSAAVFQLLTLVQPPVVVGGALTALALAITAWPSSGAVALPRGGRAAVQYP